ncbi:trehalose-phosphatase [Siccirubricoccus deserti]
MPGLGPIARAALFLDFDGTLVEIAERPDAIRVAPALPGLLKRLGEGLAGALAVVSGRPLRDLDHYLPVPIAKAGDHGASLRPDPSGRPNCPTCRTHLLPGASRPMRWSPATPVH